MIKSPCQQICRLDQNQMCVGCGRTKQEIAEWISMTPEQKLEVWQRLIDHNLLNQS